MRDLLASPRLRFVGGVRVIVETALVKTANTVAMVAQRCVMVVALRQVVAWKTRVQTTQVVPIAVQNP